MATLISIYCFSRDCNSTISININAVAERIEQLGTEFIWAKSNAAGYTNNLHRELGEDLLKMWKGIYFAEVGDRKRQEEDKKRESESK